MRNQMKNNRDIKGLRPDPVLGKLLSMASEPVEHMPWSSVEQLVMSAPPVNVPWYVTFLNTSSHKLKYAAAAMMVMIMGTGILTMMPAHSNHIGTLVLTKLPSAWVVGEPAFDEVKSSAQSCFNEIANSQSELFVVVGERSGRDELAFVMLGVDDEEANRFFEELSGKYPALEAFSPEYAPLKSDRFKNRLNELAYQMSNAGKLDDLSDNEIRSYALRTLSDAGFKDISNVEITRRPDGKIVIKVEASFEVHVDEKETIEELEALGIDEEFLGEESFENLKNSLSVL